MKRILSYLCLLVLPLFLLTSCTVTKMNPNVTVNNVFDDNTIVNTTQSQITETYEKVEPACVGIEAKSKVSTSVGSGVIYRIQDAQTKGEVTDNTKDIVAYVVTNNHVVEGKQKFSVYVDELKSYPADLIGCDPKNDIGVLKFSSKYTPGEIKSVDILGDQKNSPSQGAMALAIGCPLSLSNFNFPTFGLISKVTTTQITHSVAINPGNSGGGLFDVISGELIGINVSKLVYENQTDENGHVSKIPVASIGHSIPSWLVKECILDIEANNKDVVRPLLGVVCGLVVAKPNDKNLPPELNSGVVVIEVSENSNATKAKCLNNALVSQGLLAGDVLVKVDTKNVYRPDDIGYAISTKFIGEKLNLSVKRNIDGIWRDLEFEVVLL